MVIDRKYLSKVSNEEFESLLKNRFGVGNECESDASFQDYLDEANKRGYDTRGSHPPKTLFLRSKEDIVATQSVIKQALKEESKGKVNRWHESYEPRRKTHTTELFRKVPSDLDDNVVKFCRLAFEGDYNDMWILPIYYGDKYYRYTDEFFSEVGVLLYPKLTNLAKELKRMGFTPPKKDDKEGWKEYRDVVWRIIHEDIDKNIERGVHPIRVVVKGVRYSVGGYGRRTRVFEEEITSVKEVAYLRKV